ncbi:MAG: acyl-CoA dehydrogenase family protein [Ferrimicrobium sp.]|uniref:Acyl-CoA dehydrogenase family protein n=1 Tax=Ferrimicrobium acidiphilum TaxID=121039 RepID=A0ABV3Y1V4_9ACTN|nr:acyl-CoA dehydrogenase family protein [Ferrimicrobium sp.]
MAWDFSTEPEFAAKLAWVEALVREEIFPLEALDLDTPSLKVLIRPLQDQVKEQGLFAAHLPPNLGGQGFGQVKLGLMNELLGMSPIAPLVFGNNAPDSGNAELLALGIEANGAQFQRVQYLEPLLRGEISSGFSMTEPDAGADPTRITSTAIRDGDEWVINGHKWYTTNGSVADFLIVMVRTVPDVPAREAMSMLLVPKETPGVHVIRDIPTMEDPVVRYGSFGNHAEIVYDNVRVPLDHLIGHEGMGFALAQSRLGPGRIHHCMRWLGQSRRAFSMMCERAVSREVFGEPLAAKQTVQNWVADSAAEMEAARLMTLHAAWLIDQQGQKAARKEISMIKYFGAQVLYNVIDRAIQVHGGLGFSSDLPLEQMYRAARAARIYDGPDEVHRMTVARQILRGYEPVAEPTELITTRRTIARERFAEQLELLSIDR